MLTILIAVVGMIRETSAVVFRQNLGEMLNQVQYRHDSILINRDGKPVAALIDAPLFERIRRLQAHFDGLCSRIEAGYAEVPEAQGLAEIKAAAAASAPGIEPMPSLGVVLDNNVLLSGLAYLGSKTQVNAVFDQAEAQINRAWISLPPPPPPPPPCGAVAQLSGLSALRHRHCGLRVATQLRAFAAGGWPAEALEAAPPWPVGAPGAREALRGR